MSETSLQRFVRMVLAQLPQARDHYDKIIQRTAGTKGKVLYDIQRGKSTNPNRGTLRHISEAIGQPLDLLLRAVDGEDVDPVGGTPVTVLPLDFARAPDVLPTRSAHADDGTVEIASLDLSYSMGPGTELESYIEEEPIRFDPVFLGRVSRAPFHRLKLARGVGDSMQPTLLPGDVVMIDTTQNMLNMQDRVYAVALHGAAAIKRLRVEKGERITVVSDNPHVENYTIDVEDVVIHGRVIWFGREL